MDSRFKPASQGALVSRAALRRQGVDEDQRVAVVKVTAAALETKSDFIEEIRRLWGDAQKRILAIGRYLNAAKTKLPHGEFELMIARELPFSRQTAFYLRTAAAAIDEGRLTEEEAPNSYATLYQLATLDDAYLALARQRNLVRSDVTREEVLAFKRSLRKEGEADRQVALQRRREQILAELQRLKVELDEIEREMGVVAIDSMAEEITR
jgi:hypothetical protein